MNTQDLDALAALVGQMGQRQFDKAVALLKSLAADHSPGINDHDWHMCRACLASEELGHTKTGEASSPAQRLLRIVIAALPLVNAAPDLLRLARLGLSLEREQMSRKDGAT